MLPVTSWGFPFVDFELLIQVVNLKIPKWSTLIKYLMHQRFWQVISVLWGQKKKKVPFVAVPTSGRAQNSDHSLTACVTGLPVTGRPLPPLNWWVPLSTRTVCFPSQHPNTRPHAWLVLLNPFLVSCRTEQKWSTENCNPLFIYSAINYGLFQLCPEPTLLDQ